MSRREVIVGSCCSLVLAAAAVGGLQLGWMTKANGTPAGAALPTSVAATGTMAPTAPEAVDGASPAPHDASPLHGTDPMASGSDGSAATSVASARSTTSTTGAPVGATTTSADIVAAQQRLQSAGYWLGTPDGRLGTSTRQALYAFQKVAGIPRSGSLDAATVAALATIERPVPVEGTGDYLEIDKSRQLIFVVRGGRVLWTFNTSTGTEKPYVTNGHRGLADTPTGRFTVNRQVDGVDRGPLGALYRPRYFHPDGIAVHGAADVPPVPASHGCARVTNAVMDLIWHDDLMPIGSTVIVHGTSPLS